MECNHTFLRWENDRAICSNLLCSKKFDYYKEKMFTGVMPVKYAGTFLRTELEEIAHNKWLSSVSSTFFVPTNATITLDGAMKEWDDEI